MEISRETDYAVRAMLDIACFPADTMILTRDVSRRQLIPESMLVKIVARLTRSGLLRTKRGMGGGVFLSRNPHEITLLDVLEAIEGPIVMNRCVPHPNDCPWSTFCAAHLVWKQAQEQLSTYLKEFTIGGLADKTQVAKRASGIVQLDSSNTLHLSESHRGANNASQG